MFIEHKLLYGDKGEVPDDPAPEALRGRVVSFFSSTRFGFDALGGLVAGLVAAPLGAGTTLLLEGLVLLVFVGFLVTRRHRLKAELATTTA